MAVVTRTIGTTSRQYSTIAAWEADLDNGAIYSSGDDAVGECYNDSAFDEAVTFNGGGTVGLASVTLSVAAGERHDGTAGTGARIVRTGSAGTTLNISRSNFIIEWLELDRASNADAGTTTGIQVNTPTPIIRNMILHGIRSTDGVCHAIADTNDNYVALNNIVYEVFNEAAGSARCVAVYEAGGSARTYVIQNNTIHRTRNENGTGEVRGLDFAGGTLTIQNNLVTGTTGTTSGDITDIDITSGSYNASSDASASGTGSLTNVVIADQYVSTTIGSEDLHVKSGADVIDAGTDLGTSNGVNIDINGRDRDAEGDTWDIGAHQFVAAGGGGATIAANGIATAEAFGAPTITTGAVSVTAQGIASAEAVGEPTVAPGAVTVAAQSVTSVESLGQPAVVPGAVSVLAEAIASAEAFGSPVISTGTLLINLEGIASAEAFGNPALAPGGVSVLAQAIASAEALGQPAVTAGGSFIQATGIASAEVFGQINVAPGAVSVQVPGIGTAEAFGDPVVSPRSIIVVDGGIGSGEVFGSVLVIPGVTVIQPSGISTAEAFGLLTIAGGEDLLSWLLGEVRAYAAMHAGIEVGPAIQGTTRTGPALRGRARANDTDGTKD